LTAVAAAVIGMAAVSAQAAPLLPTNLAAKKDVASPKALQVRRAVDTGAAGWEVGFRGAGDGYRGGYGRGYGYRGIGYGAGMLGIGYGRGYSYRPYYGLATGALVGGAIARSAYYGSPYYGSYPDYGGGGYCAGYGYGGGSYGGDCSSDPYYAY